MELHIGSEIKKVAKKNRIGTGELASMIPMTRQNLDKIYRKKSIDTELLILICKALNFDFFALYSRAMGKLSHGDMVGLYRGPNIEVPEVEVVDELSKCKSERANLEEKYKLQTENSSNLQKYVKLLEEKLRKLESSEGQVK